MSFVLFMLLLCAKVFAVLMLLLSVVGRLGEYFWLADLVANFSFHYFLGSLVLLVVFLRFQATLHVFVVLFTIIVNGYILYPYFDTLTQPDLSPAESLTIVQHNVNAKNDDISEVITWLMDSNNKFDVVLLHEITPKFAKQLEQTLIRYPFQLVEPRQGYYGTALLSKTQFYEPSLHTLPDQWNYYTTATIKTPQQTMVQLYTLHAPTPLVPEEALLRNQQLQFLAQTISNDITPSIIFFGDLNITPYSPHLPSILNQSGLKNGMHGFGIQNTWPSTFYLTPLIGIPIDHTFVSENIYVQDRYLGPSLGSDHLPVITQLAILPVEDQRP